MSFGHERLDVYRAAIEYVGFAYRFCEGLKGHRNAKGKAVLDRIVAMLTKLGRRGYSVGEEPAEYAAKGIDTDTDSDPDGAHGRSNSHGERNWTKQFADTRDPAEHVAAADRAELAVPSYRRGR